MNIANTTVNKSLLFVCTAKMAHYVSCMAHNL